jgi:predicted CXXCH cytochrome family protein
LYDFRPGLPLEWFWSVFIRAAEEGAEQKAIGHVEQMYQSRCFQGGRGSERLGCVSCHDPHRSVTTAQRIDYYRNRCLRCHETRGCSLPPTDRLRQNPDDSCIDCHMPRYGSSDIPHTASTDHRIPRTGKPAGARPTTGDGMPLVSFYRGRPGVDDREDECRRAAALVSRALTGDPAAARALRPALRTLDEALQLTPEDLLAQEARGYALGLRENWTEALAAFEVVLGKAPARESALTGAAVAAEALGRTDAALNSWRRAVAINPWMPDYQRGLALLLIKKEAWEQARRASDAWIGLDPFSADARAARLACLLAGGDRNEARAEFARIEALAPPNLHELRIRFEKRLR